MKLKKLLCLLVVLLITPVCTQNIPYSSSPTLSLSTEYDEENGKDILIINFSEMVSQDIEVQFEITAEDGIKVVHGNTVYIPAWTYRARVHFSTIWSGPVHDGDTYVTVRIVRAFGVCGYCVIGTPDKVRVKVK